MRMICMGMALASCLSIGIGFNMGDDDESIGGGVPETEPTPAPENVPTEPTEAPATDEPVEGDDSQDGDAEADADPDGSDDAEAAPE